MKERPVRVLVCGSREMRDGEPIYQRLRKLEQPFVLITGGCRGADRLAEIYGRYFKQEVKVVDAEWRKLGLKAGPIRNQRMLDEEKPDLVIAFHEDPGLGSGTADMVERARKAGVPVEIHLTKAAP